MLEFRATRPDDGPDIARFCTRVLAVPPGSPVFEERSMAWRYWVPWSSWEGARSFVLEDAGRIVAHAGLVPVRVTVGGRDLTLVQLIDWAADEGAVGAGVALLQQMRALADGAVSVRGSDTTRRLMTSLGFRVQPPSVRYAKKAGPPRGPAPTFRVHGAGSVVATPHPLEQAESTARRLVPRVSAADVTHWLACPVADPEYLEVLEGDAVVGCALLLHMFGQVRLAHAWAAPGSWDTVVAAACRRSWERWQPREFVGQTNDPAEVAALLRAGFVAAGADPLSVSASPGLLPADAWLVHHLVDTDLAYLHHGVPETWQP